MSEQQEPRLVITFKIQAGGFAADLTAELTKAAQIPAMVQRLRDAGVHPAQSPYLWDDNKASYHYANQGTPHPAATPQQPAPAQPQPAAGGQVPDCPVHGSPMKQSKYASEWYCTRKNPDGSYCNQKVPF